VKDDLEVGAEGGPDATDWSSAPHPTAITSSATEDHRRVDREIGMGRRLLTAGTVMVAGGPFRALRCPVRGSGGCT
jgi:hypothetical protein